MEPVVREVLIQRLEELKQLDPIAKGLQSIVKKVIPQESQL